MNEIIKGLPFQSIKFDVISGDDLIFDAVTKNGIVLVYFCFDDCIDNCIDGCKKCLKFLVSCRHWDKTISRYGMNSLQYLTGKIFVGEEPLATVARLSKELTGIGIDLSQSENTYPFLFHVETKHDESIRYWYGLNLSKKIIRDSLVIGPVNILNSKMESGLDTNFGWQWINYNGNFQTKTKKKVLNKIVWSFTCDVTDVFVTKTGIDEITTLNGRVNRLCL